MFFPLTCEPQKLAFVGRPLDPNKGFVTLLDALELLLALPETPLFDFWVIGGEPDEAHAIAKLIKARPLLDALLKQGRISVWGRVSRESLPEFYKRCSLVMMPSHREPFGLVAIESMLCGCPVIGTRQGGLSDTIMHGLTGVQADVDSPVAIANSVLLYLRSPHMRESRGMFARDWAQSVFSKEVAYDKIRQLYRSDTESDLDDLNWSLASDYTKLSLSKAIKKSQELLGVPIDSYKIVTSRYHTVARLKTYSGQFALKHFRDRPSLKEAVFPIGLTGVKRHTRSYVDNVLFHANGCYSSSVVASDKELGIVLSEWQEGQTAENGYKSVRHIANQVGKYGEGRLSNDDIDRYASVIEEFLHNPTVEGIVTVDEESLQLNHMGFGFPTSIRETHPVVELHRALMCAELKGWVVDTEVMCRLRSIIRTALSLVQPDAASIQLCHGNLKKRHILNSSKGILAFDTEDSVYAVGALDIGVWVSSHIVHGMSPFDAIKLIKKMSTSDQEALTAVQWLVNSLIFGYLVRLHHGEVERATEKIKHIMYNLSLAI